MLLYVFSSTSSSYLFIHSSSIPFFSSVLLCIFYQAEKEEYSWQKNSMSKVKEE